MYTFVYIYIYIYRYINLYIHLVMEEKAHHVVDDHICPDTTTVRAV